MWIGIDTVNESLSGIKEFADGGTTMIVRHIFSHLFPETLGGVEIGAIHWQGEGGEARGRGGILNKFGSVPRCSIPDDNGGTGGRSQPGCETVEKLDRVFTVAATFIAEDLVPTRQTMRYLLPLIHNGDELLSRPISTAHCVAFARSLLIMYNATNRSRVRACSASTNSRRKTASI